MCMLDDDKNKNKVLNYMDKDGNFYILGEFDSTISENVVPNLVKRIQEEEDKPNPSIWFYINSNGGYCHELYNLLTLENLLFHFCSQLPLLENLCCLFNFWEGVRACFMVFEFYYIFSRIYSA